MLQFVNFSSPTEDSQIGRYDPNRTTEQRPQASDSRLQQLIALHGDMREPSASTTPKSVTPSGKKKNRKKDKNSKRQRKANQKRQRRMKLRKTLTIMRTGKGKGNRNKGINPRAGVGFEGMGLEPVEDIEITQVVKTYTVNIKTKTYQENRKDWLRVSSINNTKFDSSKIILSTKTVIQRNWERRNIFCTRRSLRKSERMRYDVSSFIDKLFFLLFLHKIS